MESIYNPTYLTNVVFWKTMKIFELLITTEAAFS